MRVAHLGVVAAHDARRRPTTRSASAITVMPSSSVRSTPSSVTSVSPGARAAHHERRAPQRREVVGVHRLAQLEHDVVGGVHHVVDASGRPTASSRCRSHARRGPDLHAAHHGGEEARTALGVVDRDAHAAGDGARASRPRHPERRHARPSRRRESPAAGTARRATRASSRATPLWPSRSGRLGVTSTIEPVVVERQRLEQARARRGVGVERPRGRRLAARRRARAPSRACPRRARRGSCAFSMRERRPGSVGADRGEGILPAGRDVGRAAHHADGARRRRRSPCRRGAGRRWDAGAPPRRAPRRMSPSAGMQRLDRVDRRRPAPRAGALTSCASSGWRRKRLEPAAGDVHGSGASARELPRKRMSPS